MSSAREIARLLDTVFKLPGTNFRFGLDPILSLIPGVGDMVAGAFSAYLIWVGYRVGAPAAVLLQMALNVGLDALFGAVPLLGDVFDATFKANIRNLKLLENYSSEPVSVSKRSKVVLIGALVIIAVALLAAVWLAIALIGWVLGAVF